tara:strand:- start:107035 stop:107913 length:879 start_codon:yes stop_codon:yes gene_type:complete
MLKQIYSIFTCLACLMLIPFTIQAKIYQAPFDHAKWELSSSKLQCTMKHKIPGYGVAIFETKAGERQTFTLETIIKQFKAKKAKIIDSSPKWKTKQHGGTVNKTLASVKVSASNKPIHLTKLTSYEMLGALAEGREPYIRIDNATQAPDDRVVLSSAGFQKTYQNYLQCVDELVLYPYKKVKKSTFFFYSGSLALPEEAKKKLDSIIEYVNSDENIYRINLTGHSDSKGGYLINRQLANERMWAVKDYMVMEGGVDPDIFTLKGYSDRMPIAPNKTKEGRAKNRRVELKLYR